MLHMLQDNGEIRLSQIGRELGRTGEVSLYGAERGQYGPLNTSRTKRPNPATPASMGEWYSYCHTCGIGWAPIDPFCESGAGCPAGYTASADGTSCDRTETQAATAPTGSGGSAGTVKKVQDVQWNNGGAALFDQGYAVDGSGDYAVFETPHFWVNGVSPYSSTTRNLVDGRMNVAGIWANQTVPNHEWIGFSRNLTFAAAKTVYVGMSADNAFKFTLNGVLLVSTANTLGGPNFSHWNIFPVNMPAGTNTIEMYATNHDGAAGFAAEIYDNTPAQLGAATSEADLTILFSTKNLVGESFDLGITTGWSCPTGWYLVNTGGTYTCTRRTSTPATSKRTGLKGWTNRRRMIGQTPDTYTEPNESGSGLGTYFPPVIDTTTCPI